MQEVLHNPLDILEEISHTKFTAHETPHPICLPSGFVRRAPVLFLGGGAGGQAEVSWRSLLTVWYTR